MAGTSKGISALQVELPGNVSSWLLYSPSLKNNPLIFYQHTFSPQADIKISGLPLKIVMEAIQQATGK